MKRFAVVAALALFASSGHAETASLAWEAARKDPEGFARAVRAKKTLPEAVPGATVSQLSSSRGAILRVEVPMQRADGLMRAEVAAVAALAWAYAPPGRKDDDDLGVSEVDLRLVWQGDQFVELTFPARAIAEAPSLTLVLDQAAVRATPKAAGLMAPSCAAFGAREPHFCAALATGE